jgi:DNA-binding NarL/FixJ family response regulator
MCIPPPVMGHGWKWSSDADTTTFVVLHQQEKMLSLAPEGSVIRVAIVEDTDEIRDGLGVLINGSDGFRCVASYATAERALEDLERQRPDVVLMDINLPGMSGIECTRLIRARWPAVPIMMLTIYENDDQIFESLKAGASGYILKKTPPAKLLESIHDIRSGGSPMSSQIARKVVGAFQQMKPSATETENLSKREQEILSYLARGYRYKEIADALFISIETVRTHLRNVYEKLQVRSRTEAVLKAFPR